ncbi:thermonuclease [Butyricicoccus sp. 1XD8-22]|nr:thermonuclease [Butyricicoccus sp. 1XD8-22]
MGFNDFNITDFFGSVNHEAETKETLKEDEVIIGRVVDGDTIIVINSDGKEERVRMLLIDTPESVHPTEPEQKFGKEASDFAKEYLKQGQKVVLERGNPEKDKYGRTLGYVFVDGVNFNMLMLEKGYARVAYVYEPNTKYLNEFKQAEKRAKEKKLNIWSISGYVTDRGFDMSVVR